MKVGFLVASVAFLAFSGSASASRALLGSQKCTWGPSYWCNGLRQSTKCQATSHCIDKVWNNNPYPTDDDEVCTICKNMVKEARDTLLSNETQEELKEVFEGSCDLIPIRIIRNECKKMADEFVPELVETLSSEMNPDTVCTVAGLCNSVRIDKMLAKFYAQRQTHQSSDCEICKVQAKKLSHQIYNADKDLVLDKLFDLCGYASSYSDACRAMVMDSFDDIYNVMTHLDEGLCDLSGMCPDTSSTTAVRVFSPNSVSGDIQCEFCEKVIQHWITTWTSNTTQEEFKEVLEALCHKMKPKRVDHCLHIVDDYYIPWFSYILHTLNPKTVCTMMGLCHSTSVQGQSQNGNFLEISEDVAPITLLLTSPEPIEVEEEHKLIGGYFAPQTFAMLEKPGCVICEYVIKELQNIIGSDRSEAQIEKALEKVCAVMPSAVKNQCDHLVEVYGPAIVEILSRDIDPKDVCTLMQLCDSQETVLLLSQMPEDNPIVQMKEQDDYCALCQYAMTTLYQILGNKDTEDEIKNALETVCRILPSSLEDKCDEYMEAYAEKIIELVLQEFTPDQICADLGLCSSPSETVEHHLTLTVEDNKCIVCEYIMSYLDGALANKTTEAEIREALDQVCEYLPGSFKDQCENFVNQYTDIIIDFLTHQITPEQVCKQIGLCAEPETNAEQFEMIEHAREIIEQDVSLPEASRPYCTLCEYAIGEMDKLITDKKNMYQVKAALDRICYELSTPIQKQCLKMIDEYTDEIIQMFVNEYTPQEVCYELGLCDPPTNEIIVEEHVSNNVIPRNFEVQVDLEEKPLCVLCEFAIHVLEKETGILSNRTLDMAEHAVEMLCSYMPFTIGDKCIEFVQEYGDQLIEIIIETELNPEQICGALTLCDMSSTTWDASPVGGHLCSFGPALWCQSRVHAKACGTIRHCEENGWN